MSGSCAHEHVLTACRLVRYDEYLARGLDYRIAEITIRCQDCGAVARFQGVPGGLSPDKPHCGPFREELRTPIVFEHDDTEAVPVDLKFTVGP